MKEQFEIKKVYVATNGDVFAEYSPWPCSGMTPQEEQQLYSEAREAFESGEVISCIARANAKPIPHLSYYDLNDGSFIATADIHVVPYVHKKSELFYVKRESATTVLKAISDEVHLSAGAILPLKTWAENHGISPATARQRAIRGSLKTARKLGSIWVIDKDEPLIDHRRKG